MRPYLITAAVLGTAAVAAFGVAVAVAFGGAR